MKKLLSTLLLCLCACNTYSQYLPEFHYTPTTPTQPTKRSSHSMPESYSNPLLQNQIPLPEFNYNRIETILEDDWYEADVTYSNSNTGTKSKYTLAIRVFDDRVVEINFGNGSVHTGQNNNGYTYSGGDLTFYQNKQGKIIGADTTVRVYRNGRYEYYYVEL